VIAMVIDLMLEAAIRHHIATFAVVEIVCDIAVIVGTDAGTP